MAMKDFVVVVVVEVSVWKLQALELASELACPVDIGASFSRPLVFAV